MSKDDAGRRSPIQAQSRPTSGSAVGGGGAPAGPVDPYSSDDDDFDAWLTWIGSPEWFLAQRRQSQATVQSLVTSASPLISAIDRKELPVMFDKLASSVAWNRKPADGGWRTFWSAPAARIRAMPPRRPPIGRKPDARSRFESLFSRNGVVLRNLGDPRGGLGVKIVGRCLELALTMEGVVVVSFNGKVRVELDLELPATLAVGARGLMLDQIVGDPLFDGRGFAIRTVKIGEGATLLTADTSTVPFVMPWLDLA